MRHLLVVFALSAVPAIAEHPLATWRSTSGTSTRARFIESGRSSVTLANVDGKHVIVPLDRLDATSRDLVRCFVSLEEAQNELATKQSEYSNLLARYDKAMSPEPQSSPDAVSSSVPEPTPSPAGKFTTGQLHTATGFTIQLVSATIMPPQLKTITGAISEGENEQLVLEFEVVNTGDRKILTFDDGNPITGSHFRLRDDVDNVIRGVNYGFANTIVGALTRRDDIAPGATVRHIEVFTVPPPKTEYLMLTIDLKCLGGEGQAKFRIDVEK